MSNSVIRGNTLDNSPNARITNTNTRIAHADHLLVHNELHVHLYAPISGFSHAVDFDVSRLSDLTRLQAWLSAGNRIAESRASSLPENFARRLTDSVVRENAFRSCTLQESQTFLLKGRMGVGKTTTICGLIEHLRGRGDVAVAFMLVDSDSKSEHDARKISVRLRQRRTPDTYYEAPRKQCHWTTFCGRDCVHSCRHHQKPSSQQAEEDDLSISGRTGRDGREFFARSSLPPGRGATALIMWHNNGK